VVALASAACGGNGGPTDPSPRIPNYAGAWSGTYTITGCNQTGQIAIANICGALGGTPPYTFALTQSQRNVSGSFGLGSIQFPNTGGTIGQDGSSLEWDQCVERDYGRRTGRSTCRPRQSLGRSRSNGRPPGSLVRRPSPEVLTARSDPPSRLHYRSG
jgi:hypothetical protein